MIPGMVLPPKLQSPASHSQPHNATTTGPATARKHQRLSESGIAHVIIIKSHARALIVPPGVQGNKITVRVLDAAGKPSGPVKLVSVKDVRLEDLPAPPREAFMLGAACVACGNVADRFKCPGCAAPFCGPECFKREWKGHRVGCRRAQARRAGEEYARESSRG